MKMSKGHEKWGRDNLTNKEKSHKEVKYLSCQICHFCCYLISDCFIFIFMP